jgi:putative ABC transport system ATP-binding protein
VATEAEDRNGHDTAHEVADELPPMCGAPATSPAPPALAHTAAFAATPPSVEPVEPVEPVKPVDPIDPVARMGEPYLPEGAPPGPIWGAEANGDPAPIPVIELADVTKIYRTGSLDVAALRGVDLRIDAGEYVAVMGPSGSGKSTLMHIIGCLDVATEGTFRLAGDDVGEMDEVDLAEIRNRRIGFVFQQFNLLPSLSAWRNVELPLTYARVPRDVRKARALEALDRVGLADRVDHRPGELSGGQQQRVAVARALVTDPALILADEPTGNLDSVATADVLALFDELHEQRRTIVLITHEMEVAQRAHRIIRVRDGMIVSEGSHQEAVEVGAGAHAAEARAGIGVVPAVSG